jgi:hypothetical protein
MGPQSWGNSVGHLPCSPHPQWPAQVALNSSSHSGLEGRPGCRPWELCPCHLLLFCVHPQCPLASEDSNRAPKGGSDCTPSPFSWLGFNLRKLSCQLPVAEVTWTLCSSCLHRLPPGTIQPPSGCLSGHQCATWRQGSSVLQASGARLALQWSQDPC